MTAADTKLSSETARRRFSVFMRAVYARLCAGAVVAWGGAWAAVMVAPLRDVLFVMRGDTVSAITLAGMGAIAAPVVLWAVARVYLRTPFFAAGTVYWLFAFSAGMGLNTAFFGLTSNSIASVLAISAACLAALNLVARVAGRAPGLLSAVLVVAAVGEGLAFLIDRVLTQWSYAGVDALAAPLLAISLATADAGLLRLWTQQAFATRWNELVDAAAMSVVTLTQAPVRASAEPRVLSSMRHSTMTRTPGDTRAPDVLAPDALAQSDARRVLQFEDQT